MVCGVLSGLLAGVACCLPGDGGAGACPAPRGGELAPGPRQAFLFRPVLLRYPYRLRSFDPPNRGVSGLVEETAPQGQADQSFLALDAAYWDRFNNLSFSQRKVLNLEWRH